MPAPRRRLPRELFETRSHSWQEVGLGHELEAQSPGRALGLAAPLPPRRPGDRGTVGFLIRLFAMAAVVILALRIAGVTAATLAVGGAFTAIVLGLAAQQTPEASPR